MKPMMSRPTGLRTCVQDAHVHSVDLSFAFQLSVSSLHCLPLTALEGCDGHGHRQSNMLEESLLGIIAYGEHCLAGCLPDRSGKLSHHVYIPHRMHREMKSTWIKIPKFGHSCALPCRKNHGKLLYYLPPQKSSPFHGNFSSSSPPPFHPRPA
ncbi:hypothetical protein SODALDRAFT_97642 [Sodiomyces alkalinus F11]|uniref:Uncharacterized protein n=1 Tax=Sodiomyces alkalinus (strain CBS 110278 / VKM F-3762 / F11) TaxID=1314773 RepID=A0A3N2Q1C3_SODAK|nr:hypothetical protein SODALDRAFT_97642 [Sodiomyces alkalinus F11]ROT40506.1 hypothetical protein SODALDRAFT_97642 [Sodiomyces alkalinus F11]